MTQDEYNRKQQRICDLTSELESSASSIGDWKIIKCYEAKMKDKEMPYDVDKLIADRQVIRDEINRIRDELESTTIESTTHA